MYMILYSNSSPGLNPILKYQTQELKIDPTIGDLLKYIQIHTYNIMFLYIRSTQH